MLNVVYVLVSTQDDYYYEQFLISATSLRHYMKMVNIILLTEQETNKYIKEFHSDINHLVNQIIVSDLSAEYNMAARSRILKQR